MKPGYLTTEFWIAIAGQILSFLVAIGIVSSGDSSTLGGAISSAVTSVGTLIASAAVVLGYIKSRTTVKTTATEEVPLPLLDPVCTTADPHN